MVSNTPITYVSDQRPLTTARIIQVDVFNSQGELPRNLSQVSNGRKTSSMRAGLGSTSNRYRKLASFVPPAGD